MRRTTVLLSAVLLAGGLAACGSGDSAEPVVGSSGTTSSAAPAPKSGAVLLASMSDAMTAKGTARSTVTVTSEPGGQGTSGRGVFRFGDDFAADMTMTVPDMGRIRMVLLPGVIYMRSAEGSGLPAGKSWLKITGKGDDPTSRAFAQLLGQARQSFDPDSSLDVLKASRNLRRAGRESVAGVATTKYVGTVDLVTSGGAFDGATRQHYQTLLDAGVRTLDLAVWVDEDSLPVRFETEGRSPAAAVVATGTFSEWGAPVDIKAPPAGEVVRAEDLVGLPLERP